MKTPTINLEINYKLSRENLIKILEEIQKESNDKVTWEAGFLSYKYSMKALISILKASK